MQYYEPTPRQPYIPPRQPYIPPQPTPEQYRQTLYRKNLRRTANSLGVLLLIFFGLEIVLAMIAQIILIANGMTGELFDMDMLYLLENGMISSIIFFLAGLVYCLIRRVNFSVTFPFERIKPVLLTKLCVIGITFSLMSNYVVDLINNTFGLFGLENSGGSFDTGSEPSVLVYFLTVAILPAFAEEFAFRGIIMGALRPYSEALAILISSAAFALMHGNFVQLPFTFCCGLVFAYIDIKTNSLLPSIIVHFLNNGLSVLFDILVSYGILNDYGANMCYGIIFVITGILSFIFIRQLVKQNDSGFFRLKGGDDVLPFKKKMTAVVSSPTLISYAVLMVLYCVAILTGVFGI